MKKPFLLLIMCVMITLSMLAMASCNEEPEAPVEQTETPWSAEEKDDINTDSAHIHSFGAWTVIEDPTCAKTGIQERACSCGEKEQKEIGVTSHELVGDSKIGYCVDCRAVVTATQLVFPPEVEEKATVTKEEWIKAFDLTALESFTLDAQCISLSAGGYYPDDLEEYPEEVDWDLVEWEVWSDLRNVSVRYNDGCIFADVYQYSSNANTESDETEIEEKADRAGGMIEFETFREIDWFTDVQLYEMLDDTVYDLEDYGYSMATYSEQTGVYTISYEPVEGIDATVEVIFRNGFIGGIKVYYTVAQEEGEYQYNSATMIFDCVNEGKKVAPVDGNDILDVYDDIIGTMSSAEQCYLINEETDEREAFDLNLFTEILNSFTVEDVENYYLSEGGMELLYASFKGNMCYPDGEPAEEAEDTLRIFVTDGWITKVELYTPDAQTDYYSILNTEFELTYAN